MLTAASIKLRALGWSESTFGLVVGNWAPLSREF